MLPLERLDAWKVCHELVLAIHREIEALPESTQDEAVVQDLVGTAILASATLARGSAMQDRKLFHRCADRAAAHLSELAYHLDLAWEFDILPEHKCKELDALRGRAMFYTNKLVRSLSSGPTP